MAAQSTKSLSFDGSSGRVNVGNPIALKLQGQVITLMAWIKTSNAGSSYRDIISKDSNYGLSCHSNVLISFDWAGGADRTSGVNVADGSWHHVAVFLNQGVSNGSRFYIDGVAVGSAFTMGVNVSLAHNFSIGGLSNDISPDEFFAGLIDDVAVFSSDQTSNIPGIAGTPGVAGSSSIDVATLSPVGLWRFEEGTGTTTADGSGNANSGTLAGGITWSSDVPLPLQVAGATTSSKLSLLGVG